MLLKKLTTEENHLKGLIKIISRLIVNFDERAKEVEEVL